MMAFGSGPFTVLAVVMASIFVLGFVLDWLEITLILIPIFAPIIAGLDFGNACPATPCLSGLASSWPSTCRHRF